jgi:neocarzinostatin family protein
MRVNVRRALPAAVFAGALVLSAVPAGAAVPSATVKPSTKLTNGKVVTVKWTGFNARKDKIIAIVQCTKKVTTLGQDACDVNNPVLISPGTKAGTTTFTVHTGKIGTKGGTCGTTAANANKCLIAVTGLDAGLMPVTDQNATVPISFKVPV